MTCKDFPHGCDDCNSWGCMDEMRQELLSLRMCGICKHFRNDSSPHDPDDEWLDTYCDLKCKKEGYWSSDTSAYKTCDDWEMLK